MKRILLPMLLACSGNVMADWIEFSTRGNGDVYFYDKARINKEGSLVTVWTRVRYKTSVMAASSYQSLVRINCAEQSEVIVQHTFFTDKDWTKPAMATNTNEKPKIKVQQNTASALLVDKVCNE